MRESGWGNQGQGEGIRVRVRVEVSLSSRMPSIICEGIRVRESECELKRPSITLNVNNSDRSEKKKNKTSRDLVVIEEDVRAIREHQATLPM